jgi:translation initiation factor IF-1
MAHEVAGTVERALPQGLYRVKCDDGSVKTAALIGIPKQTIVRVVPGDRVVLEVSDLDPTRGRIKVRIP